jgi:chemotaxis protein methyltransferase CheR
MDDESFQQILQFFSLSWSGYRKVRKAVKKRLVRHMLECGCRKVRDYLLLLEEDPEAIREARKLLTVSISRFFRDHRLWEVMDDCVIPKLLREADTVCQRPVRVWSAGCSCGEEVYSLHIVWDQVGRRFSVMPPLEVWATDANPEVLERARLGVYPRSSVKGLPSLLLHDCFVPISKGFAILDALKDGIHWMKHDFVSELPPGVTFDLIFLRNNLLTYYEQTVKERVFLQILAALRTGGFLVLGDNEQIPIEDVPLRRFSECGCIFEKGSKPELMAPIMTDCRS